MDRSRFALGVCYYSPDPQNTPEAFEQAGVRVYYVNKFSGMPLWRFFLTLRAFIRDFGPDIIHTWQYSPNCWGRLAGISCGCSRFVCSERSATRVPVPGRLCEIVLGHLTTHTVNSYAVGRSLRRYTGCPPERIQVVYNAVEMPPVDRLAARAEVRAELGVGADAPIVLTVGRQTPAKNYPMFFRVAKRVLREAPEAVFVGAGHGDEETRLKALHARMGLGRSVRMLGLRKDVPRLMAAADVFCLCSLWEGFPNVLVEAMASGLPVVTTDFAGVREVLEHEGALMGLLVNRDRDDQMAACVRDLLADEEGRRALGEKARSYVSRRFSWAGLRREMEAFYLKVYRGQRPTAQEVNSIRVD
jgi:glycosyltransferase involved in cell wall biosynthesis